MPELPEVESLAAFLRGHATGRTVARADAASFSVLKTFDPPLTDLSGQVITEVGRRGKFLDLTSDHGLHLIMHLAGPAGCAGVTTCPRRRPSRVRARWPSGSGWTTAPGST